MKAYSKGVIYIEILISLLIFGMVSASLVKVFPKLLKNVRYLVIYSKLEVISEHVGDYVFRWSSLSLSNRPLRLAVYTDGDHIEFVAAKKVNELNWAVPPVFKDVYLSDFYKTEITLHNIREISAGVKIITWYDENLNDVYDGNEPNVSFMTVITEKIPILDD